MSKTGPPNCLHRVLSIIAVLLLGACAGNSGDSTGSGGGTGPAPGLQLPAPALLAKLVSAGEVLLRQGNGYEPALETARVTDLQESASALFSPSSGAELSPFERSAWCIYKFIPGTIALPQLLLDWSSAPQSETLWIGIADWNSGVWRWQQPPSNSSVAISDLADCIDDTSGFLLVAVLVLSGPEATLNQIRLPSIDAEYLPDGPRPRLWLTPERLAGLQAARLADSPEWQRFSQNAEQYLTEDYWAGINHTIPYPLLMYKLTGDERYSARAFALMDESPTDEWEVSCCPYHSQIHNIALGYDWLYNHPGMTPAKREAYIAKLETLADNLWVDALQSGGVSNAQDTDRVCMAGASLFMIGCALWGDSDRAPEFYSRGWQMWTVGLGDPPASGIWREWTDASPIRRWITEFGAGPWPSGWFYATGTDYVGIKDWFETLRTACDYDPNLLEPGMSSLWRNQIRCFLYSMSPDRNHAYSGSDWQDGELISGQAYMHSAMAALCDEAEQAGDAQEAAWGRYLQRQFTGPHTNNFREFFFSAHDALQMTDPFSAGLPLVVKVGPNDQLLFRDGWGLTASWGVFSGQGGVPCDHPQPDTGHFELVRGGQFLTRDASGYKSFDAGGQTYNNLSIQNDSNTGRPKLSGFDTPARLARYRCSDSPLLAYAMLEADGQYDDNPESWEPSQRVQTYRRHFVWAGDYAVILDRLRTTDSGWCLYRLRAETQPQLNGDTISQLSEDGQQRLLHRTLEPLGCTFEVVDEDMLLAPFEQWEVPDNMRRWQTQIRPPDSNSREILSVIQLGPASMSDFDASLQHISGAENCGVSIGPVAAVFAREEILRSSVTYELDFPQAGMWHLVGDLEPGSYSVTVNGNPLGIFSAVDGDNTLCFQTVSVLSGMEIAVTKQ